MNVVDIVRAIAAFGLPAAAGAGRQAEMPTQPLSAGAWEQVLGACEDQRLVGFLQAAAEHGAFVLDRGQRLELAERHARWCVASLRLERELLHVVSLLQSAGIDVIVLKGAAVAHLVYPDPAWRLFGDNDLLLPSDQFDDAVATLTRSGYRRQTAEARPGFERRFGKGTTLSNETEMELDLHRNLVFGTFGFAIELAELFHSSTTFELGGRVLHALGPETRLLHACYHAALGDPTPRFGSVRDIAQMVTAGEHDVRVVLELARRWQAKAVLARGFALCRDHLGIDVDGPLAAATDGYTITRRERRAIASYTGANRRFATKVVASLPYIAGVGPKLSFLRAVAYPRPEFAFEHGGRPGLPWLRRGLQGLLKGGER